MTYRFLLHLLGMFLLPLAAVIIPLLIGQSIGIYWSKKHLDIPTESISSAVSAAFGLLAFMLAFTFQIAANRYEARKSLLLEETKNIRLTYLRAGLIPEPFSSNTKKQLVEYVDARVDIVRDIQNLPKSIAQSKMILDSLWGYAEELAEQDRSSEAYALYTTSVNDLVNGLNDRITMVLIYRIPRPVIWTLFILMTLSMLALGYQFGITGKESFWINILLAVIFAVVMFLIYALDQPETGLVRIDQKPLLNLQQELHDRQLNALNIKK